MIPFLDIVVAATVLLFALLIWSLRRPPAVGRSRRSFLLDEPPRRHAQYFPQIQKALEKADDDFLRARGGRELARIVKRERRKIALGFIRGLDEEFARQIRLARVVSALSPEVKPMEEFERLRLAATFRCRFQFIRVQLAFGAAPLPEVQSVSDMVSALAVRMESAMRELGERAALATELASTIDGNDLNAA